MGLVAGIPTIAGGAEYGDEIIDEMKSKNSWFRRKEGHRLKYKREYLSYVTVPHQWFPWCEF